MRKGSPIGGSTIHRPTVHTFLSGPCWTPATPCQSSERPTLIGYPTRNGAGAEPRGVARRFMPTSLKDNRSDTTTPNRERNRTAQFPLVSVGHRDTSTRENALRVRCSKQRRNVGTDFGHSRRRSILTPVTASSNRARVSQRQALFAATNRDMRRIDFSVPTAAGASGGPPGHGDFRGSPPLGLHLVRTGPWRGNSTCGT